MSAITNKNNQAEGFHIGSQTPIDDRLVFADLADLQNLGSGSTNAYKYYEGMRVWVLSTQQEYTWQESSTGALASSFTYPAGLTVNGIAYGGRAFNFVQSGWVSLTTVASVYESAATFNLTAATPYAITITGAVRIISAHVYDSSGEDITNGLNVTITAADEVTLESGVNLSNLTLKATFTY